VERDKNKSVTYWFGWKLSSLLLSSYGINTSGATPDRFINLFLTYEHYNVETIKAKVRNTSICNQVSNNLEVVETVDLDLGCHMPVPPPLAG